MINWAKSFLSRTPYTVINRSQRRGIDLFEDVRDLLGSTQAPSFFDIGANEGQTALQMQRAFPRAEIHSFEPGRETFSRLTANVSGRAQIHCHHFAVGSVPGSACLHLDGESQRHSLLAALPGATTGTENVRVTTVDVFCAENKIDGIDLLKTDTEGFDLEVITGAKDLLQAGKVALIYSEIGVHREDRRHTSLSALLKFIEPVGYHLFALYDAPARRAAPENEFYNALFARG